MAIERDGSVFVATAFGRQQLMNKVVVGNVFAKAPANPAIHEVDGLDTDPFYVRAKQIPELDRPVVGPVGIG